MNPATADEVLKDSMAKLETALITPLVSGELAAWVTTAQQASVDLGAELSQFTKMVLHTQYAEIGKMDAELLSKVEQMIGEDEKLLADFELFNNELGDLARRVPQVKNDEGKTNDQRSRVEQQGTSLILRIKKQQTAATTWLSEAFNRDRGVGD